MSDTIVDMPKVTQMLDAGWLVHLQKKALGSYSASAVHNRLDLWSRAKANIKRQMVKEGLPDEMIEVVMQSDWSEKHQVFTFDFTPEQALTRLAYKVHGELLGTEDSETHP